MLFLLHHEKIVPQFFYKSFYTFHILKNNYCYKKREIIIFLNKIVIHYLRK